MIIFWFETYFKTVFDVKWKNNLIWNGKPFDSKWKIILFETIQLLGILPPVTNQNQESSNKYINTLKKEIYDNCFIIIIVKIRSRILFCTTGMRIQYELGEELSKYSCYIFYICRYMLVIRIIYRYFECVA